MDAQPHELKDELLKTDERGVFEAIRLPLSNLRICVCSRSGTCAKRSFNSESRLLVDSMPFCTVCRSDSNWLPLSTAMFTWLVAAR